MLHPWSPWRPERNFKFLAPAGLKMDPKMPHLVLYAWKGEGLFWPFSSEPRSYSSIVTSLLMPPPRPTCLTLTEFLFILFWSILEMMIDEDKLMMYIGQDSDHIDYRTSNEPGSCCTTSWHRPLCSPEVGPWTQTSPRNGWDVAAVPLKSWERTWARWKIAIRPTINGLWYNNEGVVSVGTHKICDSQTHGPW